MAETTALRPLTADDFIGDYPDVTALPIVGGEEGEHFGWGHIAPEAFAEAATAIDRHLGALDTGELPEGYDPGHVRHRWVVTTYYEGGEWQGKWVTEDTPGAWPLTTLDPADA